MMTDPVHSTRICHIFIPISIFLQNFSMKNSIIPLMCKNLHLKWSHEEFSHVLQLLKFFSFWSRGVCSSKIIFPYSICLFMCTVKLRYPKPLGTALWKWNIVAWWFLFQSQWLRYRGFKWFN